MFQTFHAIFFVWNIGLRVRAQINVGASIVVKVRLHFILWPLYALHLFYALHMRMALKCTSRIGTYLSSLLYFCVWYGHCSLQESMILPESEKHRQYTSKAVPSFFCELGQFLRRVYRWPVSGIKTEFFSGWSRWYENYLDDIEYLRKVCKVSSIYLESFRGGICHSRHSRRECKIFASGVNFSRNNVVCYINESKKLHFILISSLKLLTYY